MFQQVCYLVFHDLYSCHSLDALVLFARLYTRFLALILSVSSLFSQGRLRFEDSVAWGVHWAITVINLSFHVFHASSMSFAWDKRFVQSMEERISLACSKLARLYLQTFLGLVCPQLLDLHFTENSIPLWSDEAKGE